MCHSPMRCCAIGSLIPYQMTERQVPTLPIGVAAIRDLESFDYSRLRRNFAFVGCEGQCKPSVVHSPYGQEHLCSAEGDKAVSGGRFGGNKAAKTTLLGYISSSTSAKQPQKSRVKWNKVCETESARAASDSHPICPQPHRGDERQRPLFESPSVQCPTT